MSSPGEADYGRCAECGGAAYTMLPGRVQVCRDCHADRIAFRARNAWAREQALYVLTDDFAIPYRPFWSPAATAEWEAKAPLRAAQYRRVQQNLAAYQRGEFPGDRSLHSGPEFEG